MAEKTVLTEEERKQRKKESQQKYLAKKRAEKEAQTATTFEAAPNYEQMYKEIFSAFKQQEIKISELEKLCKSYAEAAATAKQNLQKATLEYNARTQYMIECTRHALVSMQFAVRASDSNKGEN